MADPARAAKMADRIKVIVAKVTEEDDVMKLA